MWGNQKGVVGEAKSGYERLMLDFNNVILVVAKAALVKFCHSFEMHLLFHDHSLVRELNIGHRNLNVATHADVIVVVEVIAVHGQCTTFVVEDALQFALVEVSSYHKMSVWRQKGLFPVFPVGTEDGLVKL